MAIQHSETDAVASPTELRVDDASGASREEISELLAPARRSLALCAPLASRSVRAQLTARDGFLVATLDPDTSLEPKLRECILEALSRWDHPDCGQDGVVPTSSRFTAWLTISL
jgi:hypothetical protein